MNIKICEKCCQNKKLEIIARIERITASIQPLKNYYLALRVQINKPSDSKGFVYKVVCQHYVKRIPKEEESNLYGKKLFKILSPEYFKKNCPYYAEHLMSELQKH